MAYGEAMPAKLPAWERDMTSISYIIHTDGSCMGNGTQFAKGGYGAVLRRSDGAVLEIAGPLNDGITPTSPRAEMVAVIRALQRLKAPSVVTLYCDNEMVVKGVNEWLPGWKAKGWKRKKNKPVENVDLWEAIDALVQYHQVTFVWVRGHTGNADNERADVLASRGCLGERIDYRQEAQLAT